MYFRPLSIMRERRENTMKRNDMKRQTFQLTFAFEYWEFELWKSIKLLR